MLASPFAFLVLVASLQDDANGRPAREVIVATDGPPLNSQRWLKELYGVQASPKLQITKSGSYVLSNTRTVAAVSTNLPEFVELRATVQLFKEVLGLEIEKEFPVKNLTDPSKMQLKRLVADAICHKVEQAGIIMEGSVSLRARQMLSYSCEELGRVEFSNPGSPASQAEIIERIAASQAKIADPKGYQAKRQKEREAKAAIRFVTEEYSEIQPKTRGFTTTFITQPMSALCRSESEVLLTKALGEARNEELKVARREIMKLLVNLDARTRRSLENVETVSFSEAELEAHKKHYEQHMRIAGYDEATIAKVNRTMKLNGNSLTMILFVPARFPDGRVEEISVFCPI